MNHKLSPETQAALLLTAPLMAGQTAPCPDLLSPGEFNRLEERLRGPGLGLADMAGAAEAAVKACGEVVDGARLERLLGRGLLLGQAVERWRARALWVAGRGDAAYPERLKERLGALAPPILYGCGEESLLGTGGLAVVGSRDVDGGLVEYTETVAGRAAAAGVTVVSGGARGIDQAAMRGALQEGGRVAGVLADSLERAALRAEHRELLMDGRLVLVSPYDPGAGFNVGNAMQRNKFIYALADAALVVNADYEKGGTWAGAVEQLGRFGLVPVYVRAVGETGKGLEALRRKGALPWPEPATPEAFSAVMSAAVPVVHTKPAQEEFLFADMDQPTRVGEERTPWKPKGPPNKR